MPKLSGVDQAFARVEAALQEEMAAAEAAVTRAQEKRAAVEARLEELLRVKKLVAGDRPAPTKAARPKAHKAAQPKARAAAKRASRPAGSLPAPGTVVRTVLDAVLAGARSYADIRARTGFATPKITGSLPDLVRRGLVLRSGKNEYAPVEGVG